MSKKSLIILVSIAVFFILLFFYWDQLRPSIIRQGCNTTAIKSAQNDMQQKCNSGDQDACSDANSGMFSTSSYDSYYKMCVREHGLGL